MENPVALRLTVLHLFSSYFPEYWNFWLLQMLMGLGGPFFLCLLAALTYWYSRVHWLMLELLLICSAESASEGTSEGSDANSQNVSAAAHVVVFFFFLFYFLQASALLYLHQPLQMWIFWFIHFITQSSSFILPEEIFACLHAFVNFIEIV